MKVFGNRILFVISLCICLIFSACSSSAQDIKKPNVSGSFYPANPKELSEKIDSYLNKAILPEIDGDVIAIISPHAGYVYSGAVASYGFKTIEGKDYKTIIVIAGSHRHSINEISVWPKGVFRTPLGEIEVDSKFASRIIKHMDNARFIPEAFEREHSLEVQLPFFQKVLGRVKIVPIIMCGSDLSNSEALALTLMELIGGRDDVLIVASTDLSHYHSYEKANAMDRKTLSYLESLDFNGLWTEALDRNVELCGLAPVLTVLAYAKKNRADLKILKYANSGDVTGDLSRVVGYASAVIYKGENNAKGEEMLSIEQKKELLKIARDSMEKYVKTKKRLSPSVDDSGLKRIQGAFVTLNKSGNLRGCIGRIISDSPLYEVVNEMAVEAAADDPRFPPVSVEELEDIEIEVSALSPIGQVNDVNKIEVGKHGIIIRQGFYSGLLLPQVATDHKWNRETFLDNTCRKAGLSQNCWKDKTTQIYSFSAEVFSEESVK